MIAAFNTKVEASREAGYLNRIYSKKLVAKTDMHFESLSFQVYAKQ